MSTPPQPNQPQPAQPGGNTAGDPSNAKIAHLSTLAQLVGIPGFVGPLVMFLIARDKDPLTETHAREALNFQITWLIVTIVGVVLSIVTLGIGFLIFIPVGIAGLVAWIMGVVRGVGAANNHDPNVRYPLTFRML